MCFLKIIHIYILLYWINTSIDILKQEALVELLTNFPNSFTPENQIKKKVFGQSRQFQVQDTIEDCLENIFNHNL